MMKITILQLLLYTILAIGIYFVDAVFIKVLFLAIIIYSAIATKRINQFLVFSAVSLVLNTFPSPVYWVITCIPLFLNQGLLNKAQKHITPLVLFFLLAFMSFVFGRQSEINTMLILFMSVLMFVQALDIKITLQELFIYSLFAFVVLGAVLLLEMMQGGLELKFGRLNIDGSVRTVANIAAFPAFVSWSLMLQKENTINKVVLVIIGLISTAVLLMTISKGAIAAVVVGVLASSLYSVSKKSILSLSFIVLLLYVVLNKYLFTIEDFHFFRLTEDIDGFSGRTDIWSVFLNQFTSSLTTILFGFGPGDIKRFAFADDAYAHSLFFDLLLSYGVLMSILYVFVLIRIAINILRSKNSMALGMYLFTILLFATHGSATYSTFYIYIGTACAMTIAPKTINIINKWR